MISLADIARFLQQLITQIAELVNPIAAIQARLNFTAVEHGPYEISNRVSSILGVVDSTKADTTAIIASISALQTSVDLLGSPQQSTSPVILPTIPPSGYGYVGDSATFNAVWNGTNSPDLMTPYQYLKPAGIRAIFDASYVNPVPQGGYWAYYNPSPDEFGVVGSFFPVWDPSAIAPTDTFLSSVQTQNPTATVAWAEGVGGHLFVDGNTGDGVVTFWSTIDDTGFQELKAKLFPLAGSVVAPVWPGLAYATLGTPVALAVGVTITEPMDGILVHITSVPTKQGYFTFDTTRSWRNAGSFAFFNDDGEEELSQTLGFENAIYTVKAMVRAAGVVLRTTGDIDGTITPWTVNP